VRSRCGGRRVRSRCRGRRVRSRCRGRWCALAPWCRILHIRTWLFASRPAWSHLAAARRRSGHFNPLRFGTGRSGMRSRYRGRWCALVPCWRDLHIRTWLFAPRLALSERGAARLVQRSSRACPGCNRSLTPGRGDRQAFLRSAGSCGSSGGPARADRRRSFVRSPRPAGAHYAGTTEQTRLRSGGNGGTAVIDGCP
jgi:hypothetical protein